MKATRHEMHKNILRLEHLKQVKGEDHRSTYSLMDEQHENRHGTRYVRCKSTKDT